MKRHRGSHFGQVQPEGRGPIRARAPRLTDTGIGRGPGMLVAGVTAAIVFGIGYALFPVRPKPAPTAPPAAPIAPQPPPPPPAVDAATAPAAPVADAGAAATKVADASVGSTAPTAESTKPAAPEKKSAKAEEEKPTAEETAPSAGKPTAADKQRQADKDLARESWRRNRPDISVVGNKTAILIPIKGSIKGADFKIIDKRRTVVVTLPKAVSMITMRVYNLKHPSFRRLWIDQDEANAQPENGTKLRVTLSQTLDPQVEITDDFVRVTVRRPEGAGDNADSREEPAAESAGSEKTNE